MIDYLYRKIGASGFGKTQSIRIAQKLLKADCKELNYPKVNPRSEGYYVPEHQTKIKTRQNDASDSQIEKRTFRQAVIVNYKRYAIDYEVNICPGEKQNIDVLFLFSKSLWIGECKGPKASGDEPLLKAVLEIEIYSRIINSGQLARDYAKNIDWIMNTLKYKTKLKNGKFKTGIRDNIKKCVILFETKDGKESPMRRQLYQDEYEPIQQLMSKLQIYAVKAESFCAKPGKIEFFEGFSPKDY